jgi:hypothetical protein
VRGQRYGTGASAGLSIGEVPGLVPRGGRQGVRERRQEGRNSGGVGGGGIDSANYCPPGGSGLVKEKAETGCYFT